MSEMKQWVVLGPGAVVVDTFYASQEYIDNYADTVGSSGAAPPWWSPEVSFLDVTDIPEATTPSVNWKQLPDQSWESAPKVESLPDAEVVADNDFIAAMLTKVRAGTALTQPERDKLTVLQLVRGQAS